MSSSKILQQVQDEDIKYINLRFTDTHGQGKQVTVPTSQIDDDLFVHGRVFDGSSIDGWKNISASDMVLMPDAQSAYLDPFCEEKTLNLVCDVLEPDTMEAYSRCPRSVAKRAEAYLQSTGIADKCFMGPELEFFLFDNVAWDCNMHSAFYRLDSEEGAWNSGRQDNLNPNLGHRPGIKGGYFPLTPIDSSVDIRSTMCEVLASIGLVVEAHHHEVATGNQNEIATRFNSLTLKADELLTFKYVITNVADSYGKSATFMPKPLVGDNGSGMHIHQSLEKEGQNIFAGADYAKLSENALYYIGGIIKHAKAINAFSNATTNSYKRLVPGYEAPTMLTYSALNRSAAIRIPHVVNDRGRRIEVRFPDSAGNPYLNFAAMMMAGLDGILNKIHPGQPLEKDLYELSPAEAHDIPKVCASLDEALTALDQDRAFLQAGNVFPSDLIDGYIALKQKEVDRLRMSTHPVEFDMYYCV